MADTSFSRCFVLPEFVFENDEQLQAFNGILALNFVLLKRKTGPGSMENRKKITDSIREVVSKELMDPRPHGRRDAYAIKLDCTERPLENITIVRVNDASELGSLDKDLLLAVIKGIKRAIGDPGAHPGRYFDIFASNAFHDSHEFIFAIDRKTQTLIGAICQYRQLEDGRVQRQWASKVRWRGGQSQKDADVKQYRNFGTFSLLASSASARGERCVNLQTSNNITFCVWTSCPETSFYGQDVVYHSVNGGCRCLMDDNGTSTENGHQDMMIIHTKNPSERVDEVNDKNLEQMRKAMKFLKLAREKLKIVNWDHQTHGVVFGELFDELHSTYRSAIFNSVHLVFDVEPQTDPTRDYYLGENNSSWLESVPFGDDHAKLRLVIPFLIRLYDTLDDGCDLFVSCEPIRDRDQNIDPMFENPFSPSRNGLLKERMHHVKAYLEHHSKRMTLWNCVNSDNDISIDVVHFFRDLEKFYLEMVEKGLWQTENIRYQRAGLHIRIDFHAMVKRCVLQAEANLMFL